ncbi:MAG: OmpH family outer membrane protein [Nitrospiraceae bacterium]
MLASCGLAILICGALVSCASTSKTDTTSAPADGARPSDDQRVAVVDIQAVFDRSQLGQQWLKEVVAEFGAQQYALSTEEGTLAKTAAQLDAARTASRGETAELAARTEQYLVQLEAYRARVAAFNADVARRHSLLIHNMLPRIQAAAAPMAEREGFVAVLHKGRPETSVVVVYAAPQIDLTERVIQALDRAMTP